VRDCFLNRDIIKLIRGIADLDPYGSSGSCGDYAGLWRSAINGGCLFGTIFKARAAIRWKKQFSKIIRYLGLGLLIDLRLPLYWTSTR
jgi:hypothetical protein